MSYSGSFSIRFSINELNSEEVNRFEALLAKQKEQYRKSYEEGFSEMSWLFSIGAPKYEDLCDEGTICPETVWGTEKLLISWGKELPKLYADCTCCIANMNADAPLEEFRYILSDGVLYTGEDAERHITLFDEENGITFPACLSIATGKDILTPARIQEIETASVGDCIYLKANWKSKHFKPVAIEIFNAADNSLGYLDDYGIPAYLTPIANNLRILDAKIAEVTPLSKRRKNAKWPILRIEICIKENFSPEEKSQVEELTKQDARVKTIKATAKENKKHQQLSEEMALANKVAMIAEKQLGFPFEFPTKNIRKT